MGGKVGWAPPSYLKKVEKGDSTEGESDSDEDYLGLPGCKFHLLGQSIRQSVVPFICTFMCWV